MTRRAMLSALFLVAAVLIGACGATQWPGSSGSAAGVAPSTGVVPSTVAARPAVAARSTPRSTVRPKPRSTPTSVRAPSGPGAAVAAQKSATPTIALSAFSPHLGELGSAWEDLGVQASSLDLDDPPPECSQFTPVFSTRVGTLIHEFSYSPTADGYEQGHYATTIVQLPTAGAAAREVTAVDALGFGTCAEATTMRWFEDNTQTTAGAIFTQRVSFPLAGPHVIWRTSVQLTTPDGETHPFYLDTAYLAGPHVLVKVRVERCGCVPGDPGVELVPGEQGALQAVALRLAASH